MTNIPSGSATANGGTLIVVDAGWVWRGSVSVSTSLSAGIAVGSQQAMPNVYVVATDICEPPNAAVVAGVSVTTPAVGLLSLLGVTSNASVCQSDIVIKNIGSAPVSLKLATTSNVQTLATASGEMTTS